MECVGAADQHTEMTHTFHLDAKPFADQRSVSCRLLFG